MATKKATVKVTSKKAPVKKAVMAKKPAPKATAPAKKAAPASKKPAPKKPVVKSAPAKPASKPAPKKVAAAPVAKKPVAKPVAKKTAVVATAPKKAVKPAKPIEQPIQKKVAEKKPKKEKKVAVPKKRMVTSIPVSKAALAAKEKQRAANQPKENIAAIRIVKATNRIAPSAATAPKPVVPVKKVKPPTSARDIKITPAKPVSIPKISTKTARKYRPDFTHSVLDTPKSSLSESITRYSDTELTEFRELIQRKLNSAKAELNYLQGLITRKDGLGGDGSDNKHMTMEDGSLSMEREQLSQMASRQITFIDHLEKALMRIENKTYGICRVTGKLIEKARLMAVPHATLSMEAKSNQSR